MTEAIRASQSPVAEQTPPPTVGPIGRGELPWWHRLKPGVYRFGGQTVVLGVGRATTHHHVAEGFMKSKVTARLSVRKAAEPIRFADGVPEPRIVDLFITREGHFLALYVLDVPESATVVGTPPKLEVPNMFDADGRRRIGRHVYDGHEHLFLECEIEGPIANPDWGRSRASAFLFDRK